MSELSFIRGDNVICNDYYTGIPSLSSTPLSPFLVFSRNIMFDKNVLSSPTPICNESINLKV